MEAMNNNEAEEEQVFSPPLNELPSLRYNPTFSPLEDNGDFYVFGLLCYVLCIYT